jgi:hypothetical protein
MSDIVTKSIDQSAFLLRTLQGLVTKDGLATRNPALSDSAFVAYDPANPVDMAPLVSQALANGVSDFSGMTLYINSAITNPNNLNITWSPQGEILPKTDGFLNRRGVWVMGPNANVNWGRTNVLTNPCIVQQDFMKPPVITGDTATDTAAAKARLAARASNGIGMMLNRPDVRVVNPMVVGFATGIVMNAERIRVIDARIDCLNGVEGYGISDVCYLVRPHVYAFWMAHNASITLDAVESYQTALSFHDQADGLQVSGGLIYGNTTGVHLKNVYGVQVKDVWIDNYAATSAARNTIGIFTEGNCEFSDVSGCHVDSYAINRKFYHTAGSILWHASRSSNAQVADLMHGVGHSVGSTNVQTAKGTALVTLSDQPGIHTFAMRNEGGSVTQVVDASAVVNKTQLNRVKMDYTSIGSNATDNSNILSTYILASANTDQSLVANTPVTLQAPAGTDTLGEWDGSTATISEAGVYYFDTEIGYVVSAATSVLVKILRNGVEYRRIQQQVLAGAGSANTGLNIRMAAGAKLSIEVTFGAPGSLTGGLCMVKIARLAKQI